MNLDKGRACFLPTSSRFGPELEERASDALILLENFISTRFGNLACVKPETHLQDYLCSMYGLESLSFMSPGSLADWPIEEQRPLFSILKGEEAGIGVRLDESFSYDSEKSVSGILFPTEGTFLQLSVVSPGAL